MDEFNKWIQQFIISKGRGVSRKHKNLGQRYITVSFSDKPLFLDTPQFNEWLEDKRTEFNGLQQLKQGLCCNMTFKKFNKQIKDKITNPDFFGSCDYFIKGFGIDLIEAEDGHPVSSIRIAPQIIIYGFKNLQDCESMANLLIKHGIDFNFDAQSSKGARYEYHFAIKRS